MRGLEKLHPEVRTKAERLQELCRENELPLLITETWRTEAEQEALYAKGRTVPGKIVTNCKYPYSAHCWGVAFDFCRNVRGKEYEIVDGFFQKVGEIGKSIGLFWGGDFKSFKDMPHFEHSGYMINNSVKTLVEKWGTPEAFKKSWVLEPIPISASALEPKEAASCDAKWRMPEALKSWEWATQKGLTQGLDKRDFVTGETLVNMLYISQKI